MTEILTVLPPALAASAITILAGLSVRRLVRGTLSNGRDTAGE
jgi:hypothetical protein